MPVTYIDPAKSFHLSAIQSGAVTSISISADHLTIAGGHSSGNIFTWDTSRPAKPFLHIPPINSAQRGPDVDGHISGVAVLHVGFLGTRHTAIVSADENGMAFSHLASRGMGAVARNVRTTRILGRYSNDSAISGRQRKPSSVLAFSPLPLGNAEYSTDSMGLVAILTPYLLVIVSTTPVAQTQYKASRSKGLEPHGTMSAALAWFPSVKLRTKNDASSDASSSAKLVYSWSNILTVLDVTDSEPSEPSAKEKTPSLQFKPRNRWKAQEAIVATQWLSRSVLGVLTITQQLIILEDSSFQVTDSSDLIQKHIFHVDLFSQQLTRLVEPLDEGDTSMHGVVADAFYMSFRSYKGRLFLLGHNDVSFGTLSNWADRLLAFMEEGNFIGAIQLATSYYNGEADKLTIGLPEDDVSRHDLVKEKLGEMMSASLKYAFGKNQEARAVRVEREQLKQLATACVAACISMDDMDFLFEDVYAWYQDGQSEWIFLETVEPSIMDDDIQVMPPAVIKDLVEHYINKGFVTRLEEMLCHLDPKSMDIDQITKLCKKNNLYDALLYVWNQGLGDYTTLMSDLLDLLQTPKGSEVVGSEKPVALDATSKIFPYMSYILTSRVYPTGKEMLEGAASIAKADIYHFLFSGSSKDDYREQVKQTEASFSNLRRILDFDAPSFLSMLNEAFEDSFLNGSHDQITKNPSHNLTEGQPYGLSMNRQWIVSILLEVMTLPRYGPEDTIYLDMFIARNLPKFPQFILLPGHTLHRVLVGLCNYPGEDIADDCQLSVEYLLSIYQPPDLSSLVPLISKARFHRVLKSIYKAERQYAKLLQTFFKDYNDPDAVFECIKDCLLPSTGLNDKQAAEVRSVIVDHAQELGATDVTKAAMTIDQFAPDLHGILLGTFHEDEAAQLQYLQTMLEPLVQGTNDDQPQRKAPRREFVEQYVRLLCDYNPHHVRKYIEQLQTGNLRLEEVLPALENSGVVDAAVVLMAREGKIREAMNRLAQYLKTLEAALIGLVDGAMNSPDVANTEETALDLVASIQNYSRVGVWLCQSQTKAARQTSASLKQVKQVKSTSDELSMDENLWIDLIDAVVGVTKNVTEVLEFQGYGAITNKESELQEQPSTEPTPQSSKLITDLRRTVQETFTALLSSTSGPRATHTSRTDLSFLRILRAFLTRASLSSPSLSNLRAVLGAIFSAYSYEESLLALANRLLDKDLFVRVTEADSLRRRGWRPLGQVCEGCGRKVWGPGTGGYAWDAWQQRRQEDELRRQSTKDAAKMQSSKVVSNGKGKAVDGVAEDKVESRDQGKEVAGEAPFGENTGALIVFSCRHIFHRSCLEKIQGTEREVEKGQTPQDSGELGFTCPLCN